MLGWLSWTSITLLIQYSSGWAPLEVTFFAAVKSSDANIAISGNFVLTAKNSIMTRFTNARLSIAKQHVSHNLIGRKLCDH